MRYSLRPNLNGCLEFKKIPEINGHHARRALVAVTCTLTEGIKVRIKKENVESVAFSSTHSAHVLLAFLSSDVMLKLWPHVYCTVILSLRQSIMVQ
jgi:hypothetical protein